MGWFKNNSMVRFRKMMRDMSGDAFNDTELTIITRARIARLMVLILDWWWFWSVVFVIIYNIAMFYLTKIHHCLYR